MNPLGPLVPPDIRSLLLQNNEELFSRLNAVQVGTISAYDPNGAVAQVKINAKRVIFNREQNVGAELQTSPQIVDYPVLADVPVMVLGGGKGFVGMPITPGDECVVLFNDRDFDNWFTSGSAVTPNSSRMHSLSDAIAIVGVKSIPNKRTTLRNDCVDLVYDNAHVRLYTSGLIEILGQDGGSIYINTSGNILSGSSNGCGTWLGPSGKVWIFNNSGTLGSAIDALITALTTWVDTHGDSPNPATIAQLNIAKTLIDGIIQ